METTADRDAFISYSHADREWVHHWLLPRLEEAGVRAFVDVRDFEIGRPTLINIERAVGSCRYVLAVLTPAWIESEWTGMEAILAQTADPAARRRRLLPLLLEPCRVPAHIGMLSAADFTRPDRWDASFRSLLEALRGERGVGGAVPMTRNPFAGGAPFLVPYAYPTHVVGREAELERLHAALSRPTTDDGGAAAALVGMGGVGKTQLAVAYASAFRASYGGGVYWLNATRTLLHELAALGEALGLADRESPLEHAARAAWSHLDRRSDVLVVYDDVAEPHRLNEPLAHGLVPLGLRCRSLLTTRDRRLPAGVSEIAVGPVPEPAALRILLRARPEMLEADGPEGDAARGICDALGRLPLALELAGAYLGRYREVTPRGYLERLRADGALATVDDTTETGIGLGQLPTRHEAAVAATLRAQWQRLADPGARRVFLAAGQLGRGALIPTARLGLLAGLAAGASPGRASPLARALAHLHDLSLVEELSADRLKLHPLVREFASGAAHPGAREEMADRLVEALCDAERLEAEVVRRGVDAVIDDVRSGLVLASGAADRRLRAVERVLDRDAHELRGWNPSAAPGLFLQQVLVRARMTAAEDLAGSAGRSLAGRGAGYLRLVWHAGGDSPELVRVLTGLDGRIHSLAPLPDGRRVAAGTYDGRIGVWDVDTGRLERILAIPRESEWDSRDIRAIAPLADGRRVAVGTSDDRVRVLDIETGAPLRTLGEGELHDPTVGLVALPDGKRVVAAAYRDLWEYDTETGKAERTADACGILSSLALLPDGRTVVGGDDEGVLVLWNSETRERDWTAVANSSADLVSVGGLPDGRILAGTLRGTLVVLDPAGTVEGYEGHTGAILGLAALEDGRVLSASWDRTLRVWDSRTWTVERVLGGHMYAVEALAALHDGTRAVSGAEAMVRVWDLGGPPPEDRRERLASEAIAVAVLPDGRVLARFKPRGLDAKLDLEDRLRAWNLEDGREAPVSAADEERIGGYSGFGEGATLPMGNGWQVPIECENPGGVRSVVGLPGGQRMAVAWEEGALLVRDAVTGGNEHRLAGHTDTVWAVAALPDGAIVSSSSDATLRVWDLETGRARIVLEGHEAPVPAVAVLAAGRIASASLDRTVRVWDAATGRVLASYRGEAAFLCVAPTPDGQGMVAGDAAGGVYRLAFEEPVPAPEGKLGKHREEAGRRRPDPQGAPIRLA